LAYSSGLEDGEVKYSPEIASDTLCLRGSAEPGTCLETIGGIKNK
jgi:hypothetical protein